MKKATAKKGIFIGLLAFALPAAADATGVWTGIMATPQGEVPVTYTLVEDGSTLVGSTSGPDGATPIADGKVDGDNLSFNLTINFNGMPMTMAYTGVVKGDTIDFMIDVFGMEVPLTLTRKTAQ